MNGLIYTRTQKTHNSEQMKILEYQKRWALDVIEELNIRLIEPLIVDELSARLPRPEFNRLIKIINDRGPVFLITWDLSRLFRHIDDIVIILSLLNSGKLLSIITNSKIYNSMNIHTADLLQISEFNVRGELG